MLPGDCFPWSGWFKAIVGAGMAPNGSWFAGIVEPACACVGSAYGNAGAAIAGAAVAGAAVAGAGYACDPVSRSFCAGASMAGAEVALGVAAAAQADVSISMSAKIKDMAFRFVDISLLLEKNIKG